MQDVDNASEANRINSAKSVAAMIFHDFKNARTFAFPGFGMGVSRAELGEPERVTHFRLNFFRKPLIIFFCRRKPVKRFFIGFGKK